MVYTLCCWEYLGIFAASSIGQVQLTNWPHWKSYENQSNIDMVSRRMTQVCRKVLIYANDVGILVKSHLMKICELIMDPSYTGHMIHTHTCTWGEHHFFYIWHWVKTEYFYKSNWVLCLFSEKKRLLQMYTVSFWGSLCKVNHLPQWCCQKRVQIIKSKKYKLGQVPLDIRYQWSPDYKCIQGI